MKSLPYAEKETEQPSTCSSHSRHSLGSNIAGQQNIYLSVKCHTHSNQKQKSIN